MTGGTAKGSLLVNELGQVITWYVDNASDAGTFSKSPNGDVSYDESETSSIFRGYVVGIKTAWGSEFVEEVSGGGGELTLPLPATTEHTPTTYQFNFRGEQPVISPEIGDYSA